MSWYFYKPYVSVAQRRAAAQREVEKLRKTGRKLAPVTVDGKKIASTFWGKAWCDHIESYSDYASRLPRGRSYLRNGLVVDLRVEPGQVTATVSGSELYEVRVRIEPLARTCWDCIKRDCGGSIASAIELLRGKLSKDVMERVTRRDGGMFPAPAEITKTCSCPDWADLCKHVAAVLYGIGARLDREPELLFVLRNVDHLDLIDQAANVDRLVDADRAAADHKTLEDDQLADVFGIDLEPDAAPPAPAATPKRAKPVRPPRPSAAKKTRRRTPATRASAKPAKKAKPRPASKRAPESPATAPAGPRTRSSSPLRQ
jgi:uncharacterized Zn finger protein